MAQAPENETESSSPVFRGNEEGMDDLFDLADPQPKYRALIEMGGVVTPAEGFTIVATRAAVDEVLRDPGTYTSRDIVQLGNVRPLIPLSVDPPEHKKYRRILDPLFAPKRMDEIEDDVASRVNHFIDAFIDRGSCNFTEELAVPFPSAVFLGLMGLPWEELDTLLRLKDGIMRPGGGGLSPDDELQFRADTGTEIYAYFNAILDERQRQPEEDILTGFLGAEVDGERLTRDEILDICFLFLIAGLDTVTDSLTCFFAYLSRHPEHRQQIVENPSVIPKAVEEMLRWETPVAGTARLATADSVVTGCPVAAGNIVFVSIGAANVDPNEFEDAMDVRFDREVNRHLAFGGGVHRCLGSHLARRELRIALREWHRRIPDYGLKPGIELEYPPGLRMVQNLELVWPSS
ncbi:MAG TPA: cytochrome P450 [Acidimicrobiales bacterium]|nr:cytochrome P450 [Acidimicrobiales bacterium]